VKTWLITVLLVTLPTFSVIAQDSTDLAVSVTAWSAGAVPADVVDTIINRNMFVPGQRRAPRIETPADNADDARSDESAPPSAEDRPQDRPEDPGRRFRLIGSSFSTGQWIAFIEQADTSDIHRVAVNTAVANGTVLAIDYDQIVFAVEGETRTVLIGRDLTGAEPLTPAAAAPGAAGPSPSSTATTPPTTNNAPDAAPSDADARRAEILRQLRERREQQSQ